MCLNSPGMCLNSPSIGHRSEVAERRGMRLNIPGIGRMLESAERPGIRCDVRSTRSGRHIPSPARPTGMAFSCRERAADHLQKANDLARRRRSVASAIGRLPTKRSSNIAVWTIRARSKSVCQASDSVGVLLASLGREQAAASSTPMLITRGIKRRRSPEAPMW
jgi:hypothetical protein